MGYHQAGMETAKPRPAAGDVVHTRQRDPR